jgi:UDP-N-acetylmuramyl pentapeptide phosphotransferase/UDP-N-acetylglucosamine-1-phosphate transferase
MDAGAIDLSALFLGILVALTITVAFLFAVRGTRRREWITAGVLAAALLAIGLVDLLRASPRETHLATAFTGALIPVLGALGLARATAPMRPQFRWPLVFAVTFVLLLAALLFGAALVPKYLP